jgi:hypothetical protein
MTERAVVPIVERYPFAVRFELVKIRDADTVAGVIQVPVKTIIPILLLESEGPAPLKVAVRLEGVAAAENSTVAGKQATAWAREWFEHRAGQPLYLHTAGKLDTFGRWLGDIRTDAFHLTGLANDLLQSPHGQPFARHLHGSW